MKTISNDGSISDLIQVNITDKKYKRFRLDGAEITVNGNKMSFDKGFLKNKYYSNIEILPNTEYEFVITLANGETAISTLTTPTINYISVYHKKDFSHNTNYPITWDKGENPVKIEFVLSDKSFEKPSYISKETMTTDSGKFVTDANKTKEYSYTTECYFSLTYSGKGVLSKKIRSSLFTSEIVYSARNINIIE